MTKFLPRHGLLSLFAALLLSCGGGGGGGGGGAGLVLGVSAPGNPGATATSPVGGPGGAPGSGSGVGPGTSGDASSGGNGLGGIDGNTNGGTTTASGGDDGSGVGSGGTGVTTADAVGVGTVDGAGSIIVNGLRYDTSATVGHVEDAPNGIQLGMTAKVTGPVDAEFTGGIAHQVDSAADLRGPVESLDLSKGSFVILGTRVTTDDATVWADASGLSAIPVGKTLQIWGLPSGPGVIRATRIEQRDPSTAILSGPVQNLDAAAHTFTLSGLVIDYGSAVLSGSLNNQPLANGTIVRVRANIASPGRLGAMLVQWWYPVPTANATTAHLEGVITDYAGLGTFRLLGFPIDASAAQITGGPARGLGNGVKVVVGGTVSNGVLRATKLKIRNVPGTGGPASFNLIGPVGAFKSPSDFRVKGQPVNAGGPGVVFSNGTAANLANGVKVNVQGTQVIDGVLIANTVAFE